MDLQSGDTSLEGVVTRKRIKMLNYLYILEPFSTLSTLLPILNPFNWAFDLKE